MNFLKLLIESITLAEAIFTTLNFDEERFGFMFVALVFSFLPVVEFILKTIVACRRNRWDNLVVELAIEATQGIMYVYFCSWSNNARNALFTMMAIQMVLLVIGYCGETPDDDEDLNSGGEHEVVKNLKLMKQVSDITAIITVGLIGILYLLMQEESPFRALTFELLLAIGSWIATFGMKLQYEDFENHLDKVDVDRILQTLEEGEENNPAEFMKKAQQAFTESYQPSPLVQFFRLVYVVWLFFYSFLYIMIISWIWWFAPEITRTYDRVITMLNIVFYVLGEVFLIFRQCGKILGGTKVVADENGEQREVDMTCAERCVLHPILLFLLLGLTFGLPLWARDGGNFPSFIGSGSGSESNIAARNGFDYTWTLVEGRNVGTSYAGSLDRVAHESFQVDNFKECLTNCTSMDAVSGSYSYIQTSTTDNCICDLVSDCVDHPDSATISNEGIVFSKQPPQKRCHFSFCDYFPQFSTCDTSVPSLPAACDPDNFMCNWEALGYPISGEDYGERAGFSVSLSDDGRVVVIGSPVNSDRASAGGQVRVYQWNGYRWVQRGTDINGVQDGMLFGITVDIAGDGLSFAAVASGQDFPLESEDNNNGVVYVWRWTGSVWELKGTPIPGAIGDNLGHSLSLSYDGDVVAIGANAHDGLPSTSKGANVYYWTGNRWEQKGSPLPVRKFYNESGITVALSPTGNTVAVGDWYDDNEMGVNSGNVVVYDWNNNGWARRGVGLFGSAPGDLFGKSVALSADTRLLAVGAPQMSTGSIGGGYVRFYEFSNGQWITGETIQSEDDLSDVFGESVSLSADGKTVAIGGSGFDKFFNSVNNGRTVVYDKDEETGVWVQRGSSITGVNSEDWAGFSISMNAKGNVVAIGESGFDSNGIQRGRTNFVHWGY